MEVDGDPAFLTSSGSGPDDDGTDSDGGGNYGGGGGGGGRGEERGRASRASTGDVQGNERFDPALHLLSQHHLTTTAIRYISYRLPYCHTRPYLQLLFYYLT